MGSSRHSFSILCYVLVSLTLINFADSDGSVVQIPHDYLLRFYFNGEVYTWSELELLSLQGDLGMFLCILLVLVYS